MIAVLSDSATRLTQAVIAATATLIILTSLWHTRRGQR